MRRIISNVVVICFAFWFFQKGLRLPEESASEFKTMAFAHLPVKYEGRKKPIDTLARNLLTLLSGKQSIRTSEGEKVEAVRWFLDNISGTSAASEYRVVRIENLDVLSSMGLEERKGFRYSLKELFPSLGKIQQAARSAWDKPEGQRDVYDRQVIKLVNKLHVFQNAVASFEDPSTLPKEHLLYTAQRYRQLEGQSIPLVIPPISENGQWRPLMSVLMSAHPVMQASGHGHAVDAHPLGIRMGRVLEAYRNEDPELFNAELMAYGNEVQNQNPDVFKKVAFEVFYNRLSAFMKSAQLYLLVFLLSCFGWLFRKDGLLSAACTLMVVAFIPHTFAIIARCFLSGYPPVTNLYSSAIFIGWAAVGAGITLELTFRKKALGIGNLAGGISGFLTLLIAHFLAGDGDTMEQMRAVLDTRFWLTTHVITITLGYMAAFVAGAIGALYILSGVVTRRIDAVTDDGMYRMMYGTICFALLLSFVGTVLGGLWADDSWGRFWGWDPKENGALLIVLWNAILLHARWGRMVKARGFAIMAVFGNAVTAWSWFGVNQLSVGLHSYGFTDSASFWLTVFILIQMGLCFLGFLPVRYWRSIRARTVADTAV
ncbi:MAG TPA: cytochrome c biogenesis protein CcsA [Pontiella sp.]